MEKRLTIAVPAYNAAAYLEKCLDSFVQTGCLDEMEIIVVNDGSKDETAQIAAKYTEKYPKAFFLINKENGGHGSGINVASALAKGKYFKVIDADDWVIAENMRPFLDALAKTNADAIFTHFHMVDMATGKRKPFQMEQIPLGKEYSLDAFMAFPRESFACANFHGVTYRTEFYQSTGVSLTEHIFYEDQEYATLPFAWVKTVLPLDLFLYQYLVGNANQSVSDQNQVARIGQIETISFNLVQAYLQHGEMSPGAKQYFRQKISDMALSYYVVALVKNRNKKQGRAWAAAFRQKLAQAAPELAEMTDRKYKIARMMNRLHIGSKTLEWMKGRKLYRKLYKAVRKK